MANRYSVVVKKGERIRGIHPSAIVMVIGLVGCARGQPSITGTITVDQKAFEVSTCFAGNTAGFWGVDFLGKDGGVLRLAQQPSGKAVAYLFPSATAPAIELGDCGPMTLVNMHMQHGHGTATLSCSANGHVVAAPALSFKSCQFER